VENFVRQIPPSLADADKTLHDYGRWAMWRHKYQRCGSAEGQYRTPPGDADREPREILMTTVDALRAQRALARVPMQEREVLVILYIPQRTKQETLLRRARIPPRLCQERHLAGLRMFSNILARQTGEA